MRRILASLLLGVFSFPLIGPALFADAESNLPACCRRDGKHRCAMMDADSHESGGVALQAAKFKCPFFPKTGVATASSKVFALSGSPAAGILLICRPAAPVESERIACAAASRSLYERGPPPSLA